MRESLAQTRMSPFSSAVVQKSVEVSVLVLLAGLWICFVLYDMLCGDLIGLEVEIIYKSLTSFFADSNSFQFIVSLQICI